MILQQFSDTDNPVGDFVGHERNNCQEVFCKQTGPASRLYVHTSFMKTMTFTFSSIPSGNMMTEHICMLRVAPLSLSAQSPPFINIASCGDVLIRFLQARAQEKSVNLLHMNQDAQST